MKWKKIVCLLAICAGIAGCVKRYEENTYKGFRMVMGINYSYSAEIGSIAVTDGESIYYFADGADGKKFDGEKGTLLVKENLGYSTNDKYAITEATDFYYKEFFVPATEQMPDLKFELVGQHEEDDYYMIYYPVQLVIKTDKGVIQEIDFDKDDFAPCTLDDFGFEYGDYRFDGYGGFRILSTSMGKNPSYYFWMWDKDRECFTEYPDLNMAGYMTFDYDNQTISVSSSGGAAYHEFDTYKFINGEITLIEKNYR